MKNIYLAQPTNLLFNSIYLPYAIGTIAAYSFQHEYIKQNYNLCDFIFIMEPFDTVIKRINEPYIVGFSSYMWNIEYNLKLASMIKTAWPDCIIVFGGPSIPDDTEYLEKYDFIDILMHGEGEITFYSLLVGLLNNSKLSSLSNISYRKNGELYKTHKRPYDDLINLPSPYTMGLFDHIIKNEKYKNIQFDTVLETNRGCPYGCIYCCWASKGKLREFPIERVLGDLEWMAKNKISYCFCADSNFGILKRDELIVQVATDLHKKYSYPEKIYMTTTKNQTDLSFKINSILNNNRMLKSVAVSTQSMSSEVLKIIGRNNMSIKQFSEELKKYREAGMHTHTDLMLGLPGESIESFSKGLFDVIEAGQHNYVFVFCCELLPNTPLYSKETINKYGIKTIKSHLCQHHTKVSTDTTYKSRSEIIVETNTMSKDDWKKALRLSVCVQCFHYFGLLRYIAIYLRKAKNISYRDFYTSLFDWINNSSVLAKNILNKVCASIDIFLEGKGDLGFYDESISDIYWEFPEGLYILYVMNLEGFFDEIREFCKAFFDKEGVFEDVFNFQKEMIVLPDKAEKTITVSYDWFDYFDNLYDKTYTLPKVKKMSINMCSPKTSSWNEFLQIVVSRGKHGDGTIYKKADIKKLSES